MSFHRGLVSYGSHEFRRHQTNIYLLKASSSILVARHMPYFANPQLPFAKLPKKLMLSAPRKRLMVPPRLAIKKPGLRAGLLLYRDFRSGDYGAPE
jgi:hypothetical protein